MYAAALLFSIILLAPAAGIDSKFFKNSFKISICLISFNYFIFSSTHLGAGDVDGKRGRHSYSSHHHRRTAQWNNPAGCYYSSHYMWGCTSTRCVRPYFFLYWGFFQCFVKCISQCLLFRICRAQVAWGHILDPMNAWLATPIQFPLFSYIMFCFIYLMKKG